MDDHDGADAIERAWRDGLKPDPLLTVSEWADRHRVLSQQASSEPGHWRTERTPYLREIMDGLSPSSPVERVVFMKGSQIGGTECGNNWAVPRSNCTGLKRVSIWMDCRSNCVASAVTPGAMFSRK